jgi:hypothetical protein
MTTTSKCTGSIVGTHTLGQVKGLHGRTFEEVVICEAGGAAHGALDFGRDALGKREAAHISLGEARPFELPCFSVASAAP